MSRETRQDFQDHSNLTLVSSPDEIYHRYHNHQMIFWQSLDPIRVSAAGATHRRPGLPIGPRGSKSSSRS